MCAFTERTKRTNSLLQNREPPSTNRNWDALGGIKIRLYVTVLVVFSADPCFRLQEDGSGTGGYAKEMSKEWFEAAERMLAAEVKDLDIVVGTALIPGRPAPRLVTEASRRCRLMMGEGGYTTRLQPPL